MFRDVSLKDCNGWFSTKFNVGEQERSMCGAVTLSNGGDVTLSNGFYSFKWWGTGRTKWQFKRKGCRQKEQGCPNTVLIFISKEFDKVSILGSCSFQGCMVYPKDSYRVLFSWSFQRCILLFRVLFFLVVFRDVRCLLSNSNEASLWRPV